MRVAGNWQQLEYAEIGTNLPMTDNQSLELVDQDEFDEWAAVVAAVRRLEGRLSQTLFSLSQAIAYMIKSPVNNENNPLSSYCLLWAFKNAQDGMQLSVPVRRTVYRVFAEQILATLDPFYHQVYQLPEQHGVTPDEVLHPQSPEQPEAAEQESEGRQTRPKPRSLIETLSSYIGRKKAPDESAAVAHRVSSKTAVAHALDDMVQGDQRNLADRVEQSLGGHNSTMRRILRQVQLPLARAAIDDPAVLNDASHPAHQLLNDLDQLALFTPSSGDSVLSRGVNERLESALGTLEVAGWKGRPGRGIAAGGRAVDRAKVGLQRQS